MTVLRRSVYHISPVRICKEIRSWYMSPFQIWVRDEFREDFREDSKVYLIESLLHGPHDDGPPALHAEDVVDGHQQRRLRVPRRHLDVRVEGVEEAPDAGHAVLGGGVPPQGQHGRPLGRFNRHFAPWAQNWATSWTKF